MRSMNNEHWIDAHSSNTHTWIIIIIELSQLTIAYFAKQIIIIHIKKYLKQLNAQQQQQ